MNTPRDQKAPPCLKELCLIIIILMIVCFVFQRHHSSFTSSSAILTTTTTTTPTTLHHVVFGIASSTETLLNRKDYISLWYKAESMRAYVFIDPPNATFSRPLLPIRIYSNISKFPYPSHATRMARIVKEIVDSNELNIRWLVLGDDDTIFFVDNLVKTLSKYDHNQWYYIGCGSERHDVNSRFSFDMAFGGGGFAISYSLAKVLASVLDSCLLRQPDLSSDARIFLCLTELGVALTHEAGFHQVDLHADIFGMLSAHPLSPLVSLHHMEFMEPVFPYMTRTEALKHLFKAVDADPARILQQTVCYDRLHSLTVSVAWGFSVQIFDGNRHLSDLLALETTFERRNIDEGAYKYMFKTREHPRDPCKRPIIFYFQDALSSEKGLRTHYIRHEKFRNCSRNIATKNLESMTVFTQEPVCEAYQVKSPRRQCCDISSWFNESMTITVRQCGTNELISMYK